MPDKSEEDSKVDFKTCKEKYFVLVEGDERAVIRNTAEDAERKRKKLLKYNRGKRVLIFKSDQRNEG